MLSFLELQNKFNRELIGGVAYHFLNNPIISWESGFIKGLTAICALFAIIDIAMKIQNQKEFAVGFARFAFYLTIILACYGQINPRRFIDFNLSPKYDYVQKDLSSSATAKELDLTRTKTNVTLDRDVYNAVAQFFDSLADTIKGKRKIVNQSTGETTDLQTVAFDSTIFFLKQVRIAKEQCVNKEGQPEYKRCIAAYIPRDVPVSSSGKVIAKNCTDPDTGQKIICRNGEEEADETGQTEAEKKSGGLLSMLGGDSMTKILGYVTAAYTWVVLFFTDFVYSIFFPVLLFLLEFVRNVISLLLLIGYGFGAAGMMFFVKLLTPLLLLDKYRKSVFSGYKMLLAMALFGFVSEIFLFFATVLTLGLREAAYQVAVPFMLDSSVSGVAGAAQFQSTFALLVGMVYVAIVTVLFIQIYALTKIPKACKMLTDLSVSGFVAMGGELAGMGAKLGMAIGGAVLAAPALAAGGAAVAGAAKAGMLAKGAVGGAAMGKGAVGSMIAKGGARGAIGNMLQRGAQGTVNTANKVGKGLVKGSEKGADFFGGKDAGDKVRKIFGSGGSGGTGTGGDGGSGVKLTRQVSDNSMGTNKDDLKRANLKASKRGEDPLPEGGDKSGAASFATDVGSRKGSNPFAGGAGSAGSDLMDSKTGAKASPSVDGGIAGSEDRRSGLKKLIDRGREKSKIFDMAAGTMAGGMAGIKASKKVFDTMQNRAGNVIQAGVGTARGGTISAGTIGGFTKGAINDLKGVNKATQNKIRETLHDEDVREKIENWKQEVGLEDENILVNANQELASSFDQTRDQAISAEEALAYNQAMSKIESGEQSEKDFETITRLSNTRKLNDLEREKLDSLNENRQYNDYLQRKNQEYAIARSKYLSTGSSSSARQLASLNTMGIGTNDGMIAQKAITSNEKVFSGKNKAIRSNLDRLKAHADGDLQLKQAERRALNSEVQSLSSSIMSNKNMKSMMIGNAFAAGNMVDSGYMSREESNIISLAENNDNIRNMVEDINTNLMNNKDLNLGEDFKVKYVGDDGDFIIKNGENQVIGNSEEGDSIKLSSISDNDLQQKLRQYVRNINYFSQYPDQFRNTDGSYVYTDQEISKMKQFAELFENDLDE